MKRLLPVAGQMLGAALVVAAVGVLAGLWWAVGLAGLVIVAVGVLAEGGRL
ncbi:hypothetical protein [Kribbella hippodromi]